jgi:hypothetical protein
MAERKKQAAKKSAAKKSAPKKPPTKRTRSTKGAAKAKSPAKPKAAAKPKPAARSKPVAKPKPAEKPKPVAKPEAPPGPETSEWQLTGAAEPTKATPKEPPKPTPKEPPKEAAKRKAPKLPPLKKALEWVGMTVDGTDKNLGKLAGLHVDVEDGKPRWAVIRLGRLAGCTAIPYDHVAEGGDRLFAAYERGWVREAPRFKPNESLTADQELELCAHWGIRRDKARSAEVQGRKPDEISAVPAER